jgi:hypothetical protein
MLGIYGKKERGGGQCCEFIRPGFIKRFMRSEEKDSDRN